VIVGLTTGSSWGLIVGLTAGSARADSSGQVTLEGDHIQRLIFENENGHPIERTNPGSSLFLPSGTYRLNEVELAGGYHCYAFLTGEDERFRLTPDRPYQLRVGAPLTPQVKATRRGRVLELDYQLVDAAGRSYSNTLRSDPPQFAVYQDGRPIGSGTFEYG
jgi:hypothetical protein